MVMDNADCQGVCCRSGSKDIGQGCRGKAGGEHDVDEGDGSVCCTVSVGHRVTETVGAVAKILTYAADVDVRAVGEVAVVAVVDTTSIAVAFSR